MPGRAAATNRCVCCY